MGKLVLNACMPLPFEVRSASDIIRQSIHENYWLELTRCIHTCFDDWSDEANQSGEEPMSVLECHSFRVRVVCCNTPPDQK